MAVAVSETGGQKDHAAQHEQVDDDHPRGFVEARFEVLRQ